MKRIQVIILVTILMSACTEKAPDCGDPKSMNCELVLTDSLNNYLIGTKYSEDSVQLSVNKALIPFTFYNGAIVFNFNGYDSFNNSNYILKLNTNDSDTLSIEISKYSNKCWSGYEIDTMRYNSQILQNTSANRYRIIK